MATQMRANIGSFRYTWMISDIDCENGKVNVTIRVFNRAGWKSFFYGIGIDDWGTKLDQTFEINQTIETTKPRCQREGNQFMLLR